MDSVNESSSCLFFLCHSSFNWSALDNAAAPASVFPFRFSASALFCNDKTWPAYESVCWALTWSLFSSNSWKWSRDFTVCSPCNMRRKTWDFSLDVSERVLLWVFRWGWFPVRSVIERLDIFTFFGEAGSWTPLSFSSSFVPLTILSKYFFDAISFSRWMMAAQMISNQVERGSSHWRYDHSDDSSTAEVLLRRHYSMGRNVFCLDIHECIRYKSCDLNKMGRLLSIDCSSIMGGKLTTRSDDTSCYNIEADRTDKLFHKGGERDREGKIRVLHDDLVLLVWLRNDWVMIVRWRVKLLHFVYNIFSRIKT